MTPPPEKQHTSRELRQSFLDFFAGHEHRVLPSAPLKPSDPTTLFTTAGMQPFVPWFRGIVPPTHPRVATCQKCFRADDVEEVGRTPWHGTFFEMLGNFSFGDYFKREAIHYAWEYVTKALEVPKSRIWITVHPEDEDAPRIWREDIGIPADRLVVDPTNWWGPVGDSGPCGPDTELHLDTGADRGCGRPDCNPTCSCSRFSELWNLVFQMYNKQPGGVLEPLPAPGIDTGMGLERLTALMEDVPSIFDTELLAPIVSATIAHVKLSNPQLPEHLTPALTTSIRIIAEHTRALAFLLADGFTPSNEGAGYVLRRLLRRAYRQGRKLGIEQPFLHELTPSVVATMGPVYPEIRGASQRIKAWLLQEERQFEETLERAWGPLLDAIKLSKESGWPALRGVEAFKLHDTYGLPKEIAAEIAAEHGLSFDEEGFQQEMDGQRQRARSHAGDDFAFAVKSGYQNFVGKSEFLGYGGCGAEGTVIGIVKEGEPLEQLAVGEEAEVFLDQTPFYAEGGGQVGDRGVLSCDGMRAEVLDTHRPVEGAHAHRVKIVEGELRVGQQVEAIVDQDRRLAIARAHTATHMMHHVLRKVLGEHAVQSGSLVEADRLRFDFAHFSALTEEERRQIEDGVVELALRDEPLDTEEMRLEDARKTGATALFGEKYGEFVRVVRIGGFSTELCGGTHLVHAGAIGGFAIVHESSIGAGLRRIEAVTGREAHKLMSDFRERTKITANRLHCPVPDIDVELIKLLDESREQQRALEAIERKTAGSAAADLLGKAEEVNGVKLLSSRVDGVGTEALRGLMDDLKNRLGSGIIVLGIKSEGAVHFVVGVTPDLVKAGYHAGNLIREVAKVAGGGGGGRPDFAQAGGKLPEKLDEALAKAKELIAEQKG